MFQSNQKKVKVLATGPSFKSDDAPGTRRRVMLLERSARDGRSAEYFLATQALPGEDVPPLALAKRSKTRRFTHAVRMFCDYVLDQAWNEDASFDRIVNRRRALGVIRIPVD